MSSGGIRIAAVLPFLFAACASPAPERTATKASALVGGTADTTDKNVVFVVHDAGNNTQEFCTGVLLGPNLVLTSRTCAATSPNTASCGTDTFGAAFDVASITVSDEDVMSGPKPTNAVAVSQILAPDDAHLCGADLALLVLSSSLAATPLVPAIDAPPAKGDKLTVIGYGATAPQTGAGAGTRRSLSGLEVTCVGTACDGADAKELGSGDGPCDGDGGAPAIGADGRVIAINARGAANCTASVFERLDVWADFLQSGAQTAAKAGGYSAPAWAGAAIADAGTDAPASDGGGSSSGGSSSSGGCAVTRARGASGDAFGALALAALVVTLRRRRR